MTNYHNPNKKIISDYDTIRMYQQFLRDGNVSDKTKQQMVETLSLLSQTKGKISKQSETLLNQLNKKYNVSYGKILQS
jgi:hypothetical protein